MKAKLSSVSHFFGCETIRNYWHTECLEEVLILYCPVSGKEQGKKEQNHIALTYTYLEKAMALM